MVTTTAATDRTYVQVDGTEIGYVVRSKSGWSMSATQHGNYAHLTGMRTKAAAVAALAETAR